METALTVHGAHGNVRASRLPWSLSPPIAPSSLRTIPHPSEGWGMVLLTHEPLLGILLEQYS